MPEPAPNHLSMDEAKELIRIHQHREAQLDAGVTVQDMSETLGVPDTQVEQMLSQLRAERRRMQSPFQATPYRRNMRWMPAAFIVIFAGAAAFFLIFTAILGSLTRSSSQSSYTYPGSNLYAQDAVEAGKKLGITAPAGFSYEIRIDANDVATMGSLKHFIPIADITPENSHVFQEELTNDVIDALNKMVANSPPKWVNGEAIAEALSNYYLGGDPVPSTYTLEKTEFPYKPSIPEGKTLHDSVLHSIKQNWEKITQPHYAKADDPSTRF